MHSCVSYPLPWFFRNLALDSDWSEEYIHLNISLQLFENHLWCKILNFGIPMMHLVKQWDEGSILNNFH
jgi:hypothetical protein